MKDARVEGLLSLNTKMRPNKQLQSLEVGMKVKNRAERENAIRVTTIPISVLTFHLQWQWKAQHNPKLLNIKPVLCAFRITQIFFKIY